MLRRVSVALWGTLRELNRAGVVTVTTQTRRSSVPTGDIATLRRDYRSQVVPILVVCFCRGGWLCGRRGEKPRSNVNLL